MPENPRITFQNLIFYEILNKKYESMSKSPN